jgi:hypothetical protein
MARVLDWSNSGSANRLRIAIRAARSGQQRPQPNEIRRGRFIAAPAVDPVLPLQAPERPKQKPILGVRREHSG